MCPWRWTCSATWPAGPPRSKATRSRSPCRTRPARNIHAYTLREPVGVVGQIIPWNFPLLMAAWKLGPALAAGCTVVLKPAEQTPLSALRLGELCQEAGFPDGVVNMVTGFGETAGAALAAHPDVDKVAFTGSTEVGKLIVKAAAGNLKKVTLELGGKSPEHRLQGRRPRYGHLRARRRDLLQPRPVLLRRLAPATSRSIFDKVRRGRRGDRQRASARARATIRQRDGTAGVEEQLERVTGFLRFRHDGRRQGGRGGKRHGDTGYFVEPTVLVNTTPDMKVVQEEIFGPVVTAMPFKRVDDVLTRANDTVVRPRRRRLDERHQQGARARRPNCARARCGSIATTSSMPRMPFGGYKQSGWGREMGSEVLKNYIETKASA